ncbi:DNA-directed RNA polymerase [Candidatus Woesearchaeota archaeon]|nr:DNA-directed RNA polymerase [Candidatus Woesearchaeota archaeon]
MFYRLKLQDHIRVPPNLFSEDVNISILAMLKKKFDGWISKDLGIVVGVTGIDEVQDGIIIPGDGASYYGVIFQLVTFKPELQEVVLGKVKDLADFGAFMNIGPTEGMIHISQTMNDFVSFSKDKVLMGKESKRNLRIGDRCLARIIAVSYKDLSNPKLGLTMRQKGLGKLEWVQEDEDEE